MKTLLKLSLVNLLLHSGATVMAGQESIDLTAPTAPIIKGQLGMGTADRPDGRTLDADSRHLYLDGKPWIPVSGEFHYSRYPAEEWRDELLKIKAGGVDLVSTYVFWIHHEEHPNEWDWTGRRSLRDFIQRCNETGLKVIVRIGPWDHGEVRNGGFPDWVQALDRKKRRNQDPEFMALAEKLYRQIAGELDGQLWKDGGPVIGIQLDNECGNLPYLFALKDLARKCGLDVPLYTMTGWNRVPIPEEGLLPLFGGYADGFWTKREGPFRLGYFFTPERNIGDMGAFGSPGNEKQEDLARRLEKYPYACCEIGGGMISSYARRLVVGGDDVAALALVKLGCGNNLPGYYMYHGGINPEGRYTELNECRAVGAPNDMPLKDYDFNAPLGAAGQLRKHYHLLREQHLFLRDWGADLAPMQPFFPEDRPTQLDDDKSVRWNARSDGQRAFLFFNNHQRFEQLPPKKDVQFALKTREGIVRVPQSPVTIPSGAYGFWPVNLDCAGVQLTYATAQPLCRLDDKESHCFFFKAIEGIDPEFMIDGKRVRATPGTDIAFTRTAADQSNVCFFVLPPDQAQRLWKLSFAGQERVFLSASALLPENDGTLRIETLGAELPDLSLFPPVLTAAFDGLPATATKDGAFQRFVPNAKRAERVQVPFDTVKTADLDGGKSLHAMQEDSWQSAAVWHLRIPPEAAMQPRLLRMTYTGDVARVMIGGKLVLDNFYNGQPFDLPLWRIPADQRDHIEIHILPAQANTALTDVVALPRTQWKVEAAGSR